MRATPFYHSSSFSSSLTGLLSVPASWAFDQTQLRTPSPRQYLRIVSPPLIRRCLLLTTPVAPACWRSRRWRSCPLRPPAHPSATKPTSSAPRAAIGSRAGRGPRWTPSTTWPHHTTNGSAVGRELLADARWARLVVPSGLALCQSNDHGVSTFSKQASALASSSGSGCRRRHSR